MHTRAELYWRFLKRRLVDTPSFQSPDTPSLSPLSKRADFVKESPKDHQTLKTQTSVSESLGSLPGVDFFEDHSHQTVERCQKAQQKLRGERNKKLDALLHRSSLNMKMQEILGKYVLMEQYYMIESVKKAIEIDDVEEGSLTRYYFPLFFKKLRKQLLFVVRC